jgi:hypothetical protein
MYYRGEGGLHVNFEFDYFHYHLLTFLQGIYFKYKITWGDVSVTIKVYPIDTRTECGPHFNLNFLHFIWKHFEVFDFRKHAVLIFPPETSQEIYGRKNSANERENFNDRNIWEITLK